MLKAFEKFFFIYVNNPICNFIFMSLANFSLLSKTTLSKMINSRLANYNYQSKSKRKMFLKFFTGYKKRKENI